MVGLHPQRGECLKARDQIGIGAPAVNNNRQSYCFGAYGRQRLRWKQNPYWDFIWLIYSIFFFIQPIETHTPRAWVEFGIFYAIFLALYSGIVLAQRRWLSYTCITAMALLGIISLRFNGGATGCFIFAGAFLPFVAESLLTCVGGILALCVALIAEGIILHLSPWAWGMGAFFTFAVSGTNLFMAQNIRASSKLQLAHEEIEQLAKVAERERIARDLHDVLGHTLSVIVLKSELASRLMATDATRAATEIADVESIARKALGEVREAITGYRSEGLAAEIKRAQSTLEAADVELICEETLPALRPAEETVMSLALREAVTNVVRHAQARHCYMRFVIIDGRTTLLVEDDGRGGIRAEGNGLRGMRERIEALGGRFAIDGSRGTRITIELPSAG